MTLLLLFSVKNAVVSDTNILSTLHEFWSTIRVADIRPVFAVCAVAISISMRATVCKNLIYKVLNLAVLSVFVVALWADLTDLTFIYVVYILTFVSAVVMLFLSVVLMLPSSVVVIDISKAFLVSLLSSSSVHAGPQAAVKLLLLFIVLCFLLVLINRNIRYRRTEDLYGKPKCPVKFSYVQGVVIPKQIKSLETDYTLTTFTDPQAISVAVNSALSYSVYRDRDSDIQITTGDHLARIYHDTDLSRYVSDINPSHFPAYVRVYPKTFFNMSNKISRYKVVNFIGQVMHEFFDFYFRVLEPSFITSNALYSRITKGLKASLGIIGSERHLPTFWYDQNGWRTQCRFNIKGKGLVVLVLNRPWWSPFQLFRTTNNSPIFIASIEAIIIAVQDFWTMLTEGVSSSIRSKISLMLTTGAAKCVELSRTLAGGLEVISFKVPTTYLELGAQLASTLSLFILAIPLGYTNTAKNSISSNLIGDVFSESLENMSSIQQQLYVLSPMLMVVSVTGLLVALIGAPLFVSPGHSSKKTPHKH